MKCNLRFGAMIYNVGLNVAASELMTVSIEQFAKRIHESGLLSQADVQEIVRNEAPADVQQLALLLVHSGKLTAYQAKQIYAGKGKGLILSNYVVLDKLGQGGMGMVLKAEHKRMRRQVAIKVLAPAAMKTPHAVERFHREVEAAARLEHPNIVAAYDADEAHGVHFFVMQYVEGKDLSKLVKEHGPLSPTKAIECVVQAARGFEYAHRQGVVHRDIKPANLLLDRQGTVKILDMGLARLESVDDDPTQAELTGTGQIMGTVDFMAPEQAMSTKAADARSDVYSLGITLWYLIAGKPAYDGETLMAKLMAHQQAPIPRLQDVSSEATPELDELFGAMVAKRPEDRLQSMTDVLARLESCLGSSPARSSSVLKNASIPLVAEGLSFLDEQTTQAPTKVASLAESPGASNDEVAETIDIQPTDADTDPQTQVQLPEINTDSSTSIRPKESAARKRGGYRTVILGAFAGGLAMLLLATVVLFFKTSKGTLRIEINDPKIEVAIRGTDIVLSGAGDKELQLTPGEHTLHVRRGDFEFDTESLILKNGETVAVKIDSLDQEIVLTQDGQRKSYVERDSEVAMNVGASAKSGLPSAESGLPSAVSGLPSAESGLPSAESGLPYAVSGLPSAVSGLPSAVSGLPSAVSASGYALQFNIDSKVDRPHSVSFPTLRDATDSLTIELWTQRNKSRWVLPDQPRAHRWIAGFNYLGQIGTDEGGKLGGRFIDPEAEPPGERGISCADPFLGILQPIHLAFVRDAAKGEVRFFADGKRIGLQKVSNTRGNDSFGLLTHQWQGEIRDFGYMGWIDEVRVSSVARYEESFTPKRRFEPDPDTLALYHFDSGSGKLAKDSSGNNHHGKIVGAEWIVPGQWFRRNKNISADNPMLAL
ncbi:MAG: protein kinase, partial [Planctomycetota bacterium]